MLFFTGNTQLLILNQSIYCINNASHKYKQKEVSFSPLVECVMCYTIRTYLLCGHLIQWMIQHLVESNVAAFTQKSCFLCELWMNLNAYFCSSLKHKQNEAENAQQKRLHLLSFSLRFNWFERCKEWKTFNQSLTSTWRLNPSARQIDKREKKKQLGEPEKVHHSDRAGEKKKGGGKQWERAKD